MEFGTMSGTVLVQRMQGADELLRVVHDTGVLGVMERYDCPRMLAHYLHDTVVTAVQDARAWGEHMDPIQALGTTYAQAYASALVANIWADEVGMDPEVGEQIAEELATHQLMVSSEMDAVPLDRAPFSAQEIERCVDAYREKFQSILDGTPLEAPAYMRTGELMRDALAQ